MCTGSCSWKSHIDTAASGGEEEGSAKLGSGQLDPIGSPAPVQFTRSPRHAHLRNCLNGPERYFLSVTHESNEHFLDECLGYRSPQREWSTFEISKAQSFFLRLIEDCVQHGCPSAPSLSFVTAAGHG